MITSNEPYLYNVLFKPSIVLTKIIYFLKKTMYTVYNDW